MCTGATLDQDVIPTNAIRTELREWLIERISAEIAATVRAMERVTSPAGTDLHLKTGAQT